MYLKKLIKIKELTVDNVKNIVIHSTYSSLRQSIGIYKVKKVDATELAPTLYYVRELTEDGYRWRVHALSTDVTRFLLYKSIDINQS